MPTSEAPPDVTWAQQVDDEIESAGQAVTIEEAVDLVYRWPRRSVLSALVRRLNGETGGGGGGGPADAVDVSFTPTGTVAAGNVQAAIAEVAAEAAQAADTYTKGEVDDALSGVQPLDADLTALAALTTTAFGRDLLTLIDAASGRSTLGLGSAATHNHADYDAAGAAAAAQAASQPVDSDLTAIAALATTSFGRGLLALADDAAARAALSLGSAATHAEGDFDAAGAAAAAQAASQPLTDPVKDALGTPDTAFEFESSSLTGLTALGTPDTEDAHTTIPGHYFVMDDDNAYVGRYLAVSPPFTVVTKITDRTFKDGDGYKAGVFVGDSAPALSSDADVWLVGNNANQVWLEFAAAANVFSGGDRFRETVYLAIRVNSTTDIDYLFSQNGYVWAKLVDSRNPSLTIATCGLTINGNGGIMAAAFDYLRIWNSAKAFPGALA